MDSTKFEHEVAGLISTFSPHDEEHPEACLPIAKAVCAFAREQMPTRSDMIEHVGAVLTPHGDGGYRFDVGAIRTSADAGISCWT